MNQSFEELLALSVREHGHLCPGQVLGVRMGMLGLALLGYEAPLNNRDIKKVLVFVEIDKCAADALATVTGVKLGRRSLKFKDYGLMAATFLNLPDGRAFRVAAREDSRRKAAEFLPGISNDHEREVQAYRTMSAADLFEVSEVSVDVAPEDMPGWSAEKQTCAACGTVIRHRRGIPVEGRTLCPVCAGRAYFKPIAPLDGFDRFDPVARAR